MQMYTANWHANVFKQQISLKFNYRDWKIWFRWMNGYTQITFCFTSIGFENQKYMITSIYHHNTRSVMIQRRNYTYNVIGTFFTLFVESDRTKWVVCYSRDLIYILIKTVQCSPHSCRARKSAFICYQHRRIFKWLFDTI